MSGTAERREFLSATPFFGGLEEAALDRVIAMLKDRKFPETASVFQEGEQGRSMFIVQTGELLKYQSGESGRLVKLTRFKPGDFFGETSLIAMEPRAFTVVAESESHLLELTNMDLYKLYQEDVQSYVMVLQNINRELCRRLRWADNRITDYADEFNKTGTQIGLDVRKLRAGAKITIKGDK
jgi:CRP-like cAMP-binding protein